MLLWPLAPVQGSRWVQVLPAAGRSLVLSVDGADERVEEQRWGRTADDEAWRMVGASECASPSEPASSLESSIESKEPGPVSSLELFGVEVHCNTRLDLESIDQSEGNTFTLFFDKYHWNFFTVQSK